MAGLNRKRYPNIILAFERADAIKNAAGRSRGVGNRRRRDSLRHRRRTVRGRYPRELGGFLSGAQARVRGDRPSTAGGR